MSKSGWSGSERARKTLAFLRRKITSGEWVIDSRIPTEPELVELLGVGRTTVREAVRSLANLGMLETLPGRGTFVRSRNPVGSILAEFVGEFDLEEILEYRSALLTEAAQLAAVNRTDDDLRRMRAILDADALALRTAHEGSGEEARLQGDFHEALFEATGNRLVASLYTGVMSGLRDAVLLRHVVRGAPASTLHDEHEAIFGAVKARDIAHAAHAIAVHSDHEYILVDAGARVGRDVPTRARLLRESGVLDAEALRDTRTRTDPDDPEAAAVPMAASHVREAPACPVHRSPEGLPERSATAAGS